MKRRKNPGGNMNMILILGGGALAYWWYSTSMTIPAGVPSTGVSGGYSPVGGGTRSTPKIGDAWLDVNGNVVAVYANNGSWQANTGATMPLAQYQAWIAATLATATVARVPGTPNPTLTPATPVTPPVTTTPPPVVTPPAAASKLATIGTALKNAMSAGGDPAIVVTSGVPTATPYVFNYYLALGTVNGGAFATPPDVALVFPGVDLTQPMSFTQFWNGMSAYLASKLGLSGFRGMGYVPRSPYFNASAGGWRA